MRSSLILTLLAVTALTGCRKHRVVVSPPAAPAASANTLVEGTVIKSAGTWAHSERGSHCTFTAGPAGAGIHWSYQFSGSKGNGTTSSSFSLSSPTTPWFIYVESPERLWFFSGENLYYHRWDPDGSGNAIIGGTLKMNPEDVPSGLVPHLPAELQKLFPPVDNKRRPSI